MLMDRLSISERRACRATTAHQLRHWFGTNLYAQSHDIRITQEMLGHASSATTAIYTNPQELHQTREKAQVAC